MPVILLERIPLPSLRAYTGFSVILLACAVFYAYQVVLSVEYESDTGYSEIDVLDQQGDTNVEVHYMNISLPHDTLIWNMFYVMTAEAWCVWVCGTLNCLMFILIFAYYIYEL